MGTTTSKAVPFKFLELPPEIRCMIYEELVVVGKVYFKGTDQEHENSVRYYDKAYFRKPSLAILRVCSLVHQEAEPIYLSKNLFVLPLGWQTMEPFYSTTCVLAPGPHSPSSLHLFSTNAMHHLKNLSIAFDKEEHANMIFDRKRWASMPDIAAATRTLTHSQRLLYIHDETLDKIAHGVTGSSRSWFSISNTLIYTPGGTGCSRLRYVEVDYTNAYCPLGCCRPVESIDHDWVHITGTEKLVFLGTKQQEIDVILNSLDELCTCDWERPFCIKFKREPKLGYVDHWSKWRCDKPQRENGDDIQGGISRLASGCSTPLLHWSKT
ncbi:hypothetical protein K491DRAFT_179653 [Lophiostoma macrostomum CBS 122681]|uniref:F-box domain-containing protein n=1 Tax=Lophiostoma macrostomum CBS 122681 TaxID=1314788 RepID=A0A6A6TU41_9PLEO|nr:hypothetical protein K491DRAFT_179653 [Lophiostoma macrostomum CBS 122681]